MPNSLGSTASRFSFGEIGFLKTASSDSASRARGRVAVGGRVLHAVGNPDVGDAGLAERLAHGRADFAATDAMLDPELADALVRDATA